MNDIIVKTKINTNEITLVFGKGYQIFIAEKFGKFDLTEATEYFLNNYTDSLKKHIKRLYKSKKLNNFVCEVSYSTFCVTNVNNKKI